MILLSQKQQKDPLQVSGTFVNPRLPDGFVPKERTGHQLLRARFSRSVLWYLYITCGLEILSMIMFEPSCLYKIVTKMTSVTKASPPPPSFSPLYQSSNITSSSAKCLPPPTPTKIKASQNTKLPHSPNIKWPSAKYQMSPELSNTSLDMKYTQISNVLQIMMWKSCSCKTSEIDLGKHWRGLAWERPVILLQNVSPPLSLAFSLSLHFTLLLSLSLTLSDHPKLSMDSQLTQQEATRFRLLWEEFLLVSSWWWGLNCSFQPSRLHKFSY